MEEAVPLDETEEFALPEGAMITFRVYWDDEALIGETAHFEADVYGLENYDYVLQWQQSPDDKKWENIEGAQGERMDLVVTEEANELYYRVVAIVKPIDEEALQEEAEQLGETIKDENSAQAEETEGAYFEEQGETVMETPQE